MSTILETVLGISGSFEGGNGSPRFDLVSGDFDSCGTSWGALQWNVGTGSIVPLIHKAQEHGTTDPKFREIYDLAGMDVAHGLAWVRAHWVDAASTNHNLTKDAASLIREFLLTPGSIQAQIELAQGILDAALVEAQKFLPWIPNVQDNLRVAAFFFDVRVQQGGLSKKLKDGTRKPDILADASHADPQRAIRMGLDQKRVKTANAWKAVLDSGDTLASVLLHYAYERAILARAEYQWDTLSRRGTIACRTGSVHGAWFNFGQTLP